jgi:MFS family permease
VADGLRYARRHAGLGPLLLYAAFAALLMRGVQEILPPFVERSFGRGADSLAVLTACIGIGSLVAGLWVANRGRMEGSTRLAVWSGLAMAVATASFAATDNFAIGLFCGALIGAAGSIHGISVQTLLQSATESEFRGRMLSLWGMITRACPALGALALGAAGEAFGLRIPTLVAVAVFLGVLVWGVARLGRMEQVLEATPAGRRPGKDDG